MRPQDVIRKKRDGQQLSGAEIEFFIAGITHDEIADYQVSALLMAIYLNGMNEVEQQALTEAMLRSGITLDFSSIAKPKADKHSTGGVGDKTSLIIAPLVAACGVCVPMISGRGLEIPAARSINSNRFPATALTFPPKNSATFWSASDLPWPDKQPSWRPPIRRCTRCAMLPLLSKQFP